MRIVHRYPSCVRHDNCIMSCSRRVSLMHLLLLWVGRVLLPPQRNSPGHDMPHAKLPKPRVAYDVGDRQYKWGCTELWSFCWSPPRRQDTNESCFRLSGWFNEAWMPYVELSRILMSFWHSRYAICFARLDSSRESNGPIQYTSNI